ncbi:MAG: sensor histidine kinase [Acidimicrobiales bacterium]
MTIQRGRVATSYVGPERRATGGPVPMAALLLMLGALIIGLFVIGAEQLYGHPFMPATVSRSLGATVDSMTISVAVLSIAALWARHRAAPDRMNLTNAAIVAVVFTAVIPADLATDAKYSAATLGFVVVTRVAVVGLFAGLLLAAEIRSRQDFLRFVVSAIAAVWLAGSLTTIALDFVGVDAISGRVVVNVLAGVLLILLTLLLGAAALRGGKPRLMLMSFVAMAFAMADMTSAVADDLALGLVTGKVVRTVGVAAILIFTVLELRNIALSERDSALRAHSDSARAADRLVAQLDQQERFVHDARNALLAIEGGLQAVELDVRDTSMIRTLKLEVDRLRHSIESDDGDPLPQNFDIGQTLEPMIDVYRAAGTAVSLAIEGQIWARGRASVTAEVTQNLIDNAIRYANGSEIIVWIYEVNDMVNVRVGDRGEGIAAENREVIFQRGHSGGDSSGVGLHISRKLVESQGGLLEVTNRHGGGALFTFTVPPGVSTAHVTMRAVDTVVAS